MPLGVGVVHLGEDGRQRAVSPVAPEDADRVEDVAEHPGAREHEHPAAAQVDVVAPEIGVDVRPDRRGGAVAEVVRHPEGRERAHGQRQVRQLIEVGEPQVAAVGERPAHPARS